MRVAVSLIVLAFSGWTGHVLRPDGSRQWRIIQPQPAASPRFVRHDLRRKPLQPDRGGDVDCSWPDPDGMNVVPST